MRSMHATYSIELGRRLRTARRARGWCLAEASEGTGGRFGAAAIGTYERGERAISVNGLAILAAAYHTSTAALLPRENTALLDDPGTDQGPIMLRTDRLERLPAHLAGPIGRYTTAVQAARNNTTTSIEARHGDLFVLAAIMNITPASLIGQLRHWGMLTDPSSN